MIRRIFPLILVSLASIGFAQTTLPAILAGLDQSTPRSALKLFYAAQARDDGDAIAHLLLAANPAEQHLINAVADQKNSDRVLTDAMLARFPDQWKTDPRKEELSELSGVFANIDRAELRVDKDVATLRAADSDKPPFTLKRVDGKWRIPLEVLFQNLDPNDVERRVHQIEIQAKVMQQAAIDVANGKYATKDQAVQDAKERIFEAALADHTASTQPATQP